MAQSVLAQEPGVRHRVLSRDPCVKTGTFSAPATIEPMPEQTQQPLEQQLEEIGTQLAWVRDYL
jgi:hypothetical protein